MVRIKQVSQADVVIMMVDALLVDAKLAFLIDDITQDMAHDEIVARLKEIREISYDLYTKLKEIKNNGDVILVSKP